MRSAAATGLPHQITAFLLAQLYCARHISYARRCPKLLSRLGASTRLDPTRLDSTIPVGVAYNYDVHRCNFVTISPRIHFTLCYTHKFTLYYCTAPIIFDSFFDGNAEVGWQNYYKFSIDCGISLVLETRHFYLHDFMGCTALF